MTRYLVVLSIVVGDDLARLQPGPRPYRPHVDGGARHGHRRRADRHQALPTKLLAFAVSSFYCGVAGALMVFLWLGAAEADSFNINQSFLILFMVIIGGLGSLIGSFFGAALIWGLPIVLRRAAANASGVGSMLGHRRAPPVHDRRGADHLLPDRRAARPGAAVADRQAETEGVAFPVLRCTLGSNGLGTAR